MAKMMTKVEAIRALATLSYGTLGTLTGLRRYTELDAALERVYQRIEEVDVTGCENWVDVWNLCYRPVIGEAGASA